MDFGAEALNRINEVEQSHGPVAQPKDTRMHTLWHRIVHTLLPVSCTYTLTPLSNSEISPQDTSITYRLSGPLMPGKRALCWLLQNKETPVYKATLLSLSLAWLPVVTAWKTGVSQCFLQVLQFILCVKPYFVSTCLVYECEWIVFYSSVSMYAKILLIQDTFLDCHFCEDFGLFCFFFLLSCTLAINRECIWTV